VTAAALLYVDASVVTLPGAGDVWMSGLNDLIEHVNTNRYSVELVVVCQPVMSRDARARIARLRCDLATAPSPSAVAAGGAIALDANVRAKRLAVRQVWWLTLHRPSTAVERRLSAPSWSTRILPADLRVHPPGVEDIEEVLLSWCPPAEADPTTVDRVVVTVDAIGDVEELIAFSRHVALTGARVLVLAESRDDPLCVRLERAGIGVVRLGRRPEGAPYTGARIGRLVWVSRTAQRDVEQDQHLVPYAREVVPVPPPPAGAWMSILERIK
jgi:hypothetical protein